jgi:hypothetical protein
MSSVVGKMFDRFPKRPQRNGIWNDFNSDEELAEFTVTSIAGGSASVVDTIPNGVLRIAGAATTDNSGAEVQRDAATVAFEVSQTYRMLGRFNLSDSTQCDFYTGLCTLDTSIIASLPTDGILLQKLDDVATLDVLVRKAGTTQVTLSAVATLASATWYEFALQVAMTSTTGTGTVTLWLNDVVVATFSTAFLPTGMLAEFAAMQSGNATGTKTADVDFIGLDWTR